jgi:UDP-N-acetylglucosamine diphosphorylase/glucosamine-1-phosphate N-acetyltransferase
MSTLGEKLTAKIGATDVAYFVPEYMADACREQTNCPVNDTSALRGDQLLILNPRIKADSFTLPNEGSSRLGLDAEGELLYARISEGDAARLPSDDIAEFIEAAKAAMPTEKSSLPTWNYIWDLMLANSEQITADFAAASRCGTEGRVEQPNTIRGSKKDVFIAPGAVIHPMVAIDAAGGPVYIDEGAEIHSFTRIEGPCYVGRDSILLGAKCRAGNSIGPVCRIGGEVEESIIHGYSNKYHDGFLGHAYVGEWVNLGALTANSDLKNDYTNVSVKLNGRQAIDTGSPKVGSLIGDHAKTSIGTLLNTGSYVGAMAMVLATGKPLPKFIASFTWLIDGAATKGFGRKKQYETAKAAMARRNCQWTEAQERMWNAVFEMTAPVRNDAIKRGRRTKSRSLS